MGKQKTFLLSANDLKIAIKSTKAPKTLCIFINKQHLLSLKSGRAQVSLGPSSLEGCVTNYHIVPPEITHFASKQCIEVQASGSDARASAACLGLRPGKPSAFIEGPTQSKILENLLRTVVKTWSWQRQQRSVQHPRFKSYFKCH